MRVVIVGGGVVGSFLAQILEENNEVTIVDSNAEKCSIIREQLGKVRVVCEDGCEPWVLEFAGVPKADLVLAVTGDDEDNLVISYLSKYEYDAPKVIGRVNHPKNKWLFTRSWGVDVEVSTPDIIAKIIEEETSLGEVVTVMKLKASEIGLVEITIPEDAPAVGKALADLDMPPETLVVTIVRGEAMTIPRADTVIQPGDRVMAMTNVTHQDALKRLLGHS